MWFRSYFTDRKLCVKFKEIKSITVNVNFGVP